MQPIPQTFTVRDLQRQYRSIIETAKKTQEAVVLINNSRPEAVLMDIGTYAQLATDDYVFDEDKTLKLLAQAKNSYRRGHAKVLRSWDELDR